MAKRIVLGVCASIAAYKACDIARRLMDQGATVDVILTPEASQFVTALTFATLTGRPVYGEMFDHHSWRMPHIELAKAADALLIAPATANVIGKMANGLADDVLTTLVLTTRAPIFIAPAMNDEMYANAVVVDNCAKLKKHGVKFIEPTKGQLACGVIGIGHLADVEDIVKTVLR